MADELSLMLALEARENAAQVIEGLASKLEGFASKFGLIAEESGKAEAAAGHMKSIESSIAKLTQAVDKNSATLAGHSAVIAEHFGKTAASVEGAASRVSNAEQEMARGAALVEGGFARMEGAGSGITAMAVGAEELAAGLEKPAEGAGKLRMALGGAMVVGGTALAGLGLAAADFGMSAVHSAGDFQEQMTAVVTQAGESKDAIGGVTDAVLNMAGAVGSSPEELAKGLYFVESAGFHGSDALQVLEASAEGAKVGLADQATVANALTTVLTDYGLKGDAAANTTSQLLQAVALGKMRMEDFSASLGTVVPTAANAGIGFDQVGAALATMTNAGVPAAVAATYLRQTISQLQVPSKQAQTALKELGLGSHDLADMVGQGNLVGALNVLNDKLNETFGEGPSASKSAALQHIAGGVKTMQGVMELTGPHIEALNQNLEDMQQATEGAGKLAESWAEAQGDLNIKTEELKSGVEAVTDRIGLAMIPTVVQLMTAVQPFLQQLTAWVNQNPQLTAGIIAVTAVVATLMGVAIALAGTMVLLGAAFAPVTVAVLAIAAAVAVGVYALQNWDAVQGEMQGITTSAWDTIQSALATALDWVNTTFPEVTSGVQTVWQVMSDFLQAATQAIGDFIQQEFGVVLEWFQANWPLMQQTAQMVWSAIQTLTAAVLSALMSNIQDALHTILGWWQDHGTTVMTVVSTMWDIVKTVIDTTLKEILNLITLALHVLNGDWQAAWDDVVRINQSALDAIGKILNDLVTIVTVTLGEVLRSVAGFVPEWLNMGAELAHALINGLVSGIQAGAGQIMGTLSNLASSALNAAKAAVGAHSPSTEMHELGLDMTEGLALGLLDGAGNVIGTANQLMNQIIGTVTDRALNAAAAAASSTHGIGTATDRMLDAAAAAASASAAAAFGSFGARERQAYNQSSNSLSNYIPAGSQLLTDYHQGGGTTTINYIDMRGSQVMSDQDINILIDKISRRLVPQLGIAGAQVLR